MDASIPGVHRASARLRSGPRRLPREPFERPPGYAEPDFAGAQSTTPANRWSEMDDRGGYRSVLLITRSLRVRIR
jgi:hypothetical protein